MDLLLDTHIFIWWDATDGRLGKPARGLIPSQQNRVFVSAASVWEIAIKSAIGRLAFTGSPAAAVARNGFTSLSITGDHAEAAARLPMVHRDPFDRVIVSQAMTEGLTLVTADPLVRAYGVTCLWAG